jgi:xanthine dehydrogenase accessory factor
MNPFAELFASLISAVHAGRRCAFCTVVGSRGSTPQTGGASMLLHPDGRTEGTLGGGCIEAEVRRRAMEMLAAGQSGLLTFDLDHDYGWDDGLICGGQMDITVLAILHPQQLAPFADAAEHIQTQRRAELAIRVPHEGRTIQYLLRIEPTPTLLIAGAGHVGAALARLAVGLDFRTLVLDDRADLLTAERLPPPIEPLTGDIAERLRSWPINANTYVVIVTRGHRHDEQALKAVIDSPARYVGMIGSRRKIGLIFADLAELGVAREQIERVHAPIGLNIGALTVPELAVSIAGELIHVRRAERLKQIEGPTEVGSCK